MDSVTTEQMEHLGSLLSEMSKEQLYLVKNKIEQVLFDRMVGGKKDFTLKVERDPSQPFGVKVELPPDLQALIDNTTEELRKAVADLHTMNFSPGEKKGILDEPAEKS